MEISKISYKFKISVTLREYSRALVFLESIGSYIEELSHEDVDLIKSLQMGILKQHRDYLLTLKEEEQKSNNNKYIFKTVHEDYSNNLLYASINTIESFIKCINNLLNKVKEKNLVAVMHVIRAKLFLFIAEFNEEDKTRSLASAYANYKTAVEIFLKYNDKKDMHRFKIFYSYCKFLSKYLNDKYRAMLFCINFIDDLHAMKSEEAENEEEEEEEEDEKNEMGEENNLDDPFKSNRKIKKNKKMPVMEKIFETEEFKKMETKLKLFYESNLEDYNIALRKYHPEYY